MMFVTVCRILVVKTCDQDALHEQRFLPPLLVVQLHSNYTTMVVLCIHGFA